MTEVEFSDGSNDSIEAGGGFFFGLAFENKLPTETPTPLYGRLVLSYMKDSVNAENGSVSFTRLPVDALLITKFNQFSLAGGITYHLAPTYKQDFDSSFVGEVELDNALGLALEANYTLRNSKMNIGVRYTNITYSASGFEDLDGAGFAITVGVMF